MDFQVGVSRVSKLFRVGYQAGISGIFWDFGISGGYTRKIPESNTRKILEIPEKVPEKFGYIFRVISGMKNTQNTRKKYPKITQIFG